MQSLRKVCTARPFHLANNHPSIFLNSSQRISRLILDETLVHEKMQMHVHGTKVRMKESFVRRFISKIYNQTQGSGFGVQQKSENTLIKLLYKMNVKTTNGNYVTTAYQATLY